MPPFKAAWCCRHVRGFRYAGDTRPLYHRSMRVLIVEDEPYMAEAIRDGLRLEAIAADIAGDGDAALELLSVNAYDIAVLDRDVPGPTGDEIARRIVATGSGMPILMLTAADRLDDKATGFELGAEELLERAWDQNTDPFTNAVRITVSALRKRLGEPWIIATVAGVGYRIDTQPDTGREGEDRG